MKGTLKNKDREKLEKWKAKAKSRSKLIKRLRLENRRLRERSDKWKNRYKEQKCMGKPQRVKRYAYSLELMWLGVLIHIKHNVSLRASSQVLRAVGELYGLGVGKASVSTIRNWCLKVSFYFLQCTPPSGRYALIGDECVGVGREHLLVLLLAPLDGSSPVRPLEMKDVLVWSIQSQASWSGAAIARMIEQKRRQNGITIEYAISDAASNLRKGFADSKLKWISDCTHVLANCTQKLLKKDKSFNDFVKDMLATRAKWVMSQQHLYLPPALRAKSRFHQLLVVHQWADRLLEHWQELPEPVQVELQYVWHNQQLIALLRELHSLIEQFAALFKASGINAHTLQCWQQALDKWRQQRQENQQETPAKIEEFISTMNQYLHQQKEVLPDAQQILCCSDVIESIFGKYKNKGGCPWLSEDILTIAAYPKTISKKEVYQALIQTCCKDIQQWKKDFTTPSTLSLKKQLFKTFKKMVA